MLNSKEKINDKMEALGWGAFEGINEVLLEKVTLQQWPEELKKASFYKAGKGGFLVEDMNP